MMSVMERLKKKASAMSDVKSKDTDDQYAIQGVLVTANGELTAKKLFQSKVTENSKVNHLIHFEYFSIENAQIVQYPSNNKNVNQFIMALYGLFVKELRGDYLIFREKGKPVITVEDIKEIMQRNREYPMLYRYLSYYCITQKLQAKHDLLCVIAVEKSKASKKQIKTYEKAEKKLSEGFCFYMMSYLGSEDFSGLPMGLPLCWFVMSIGPRTIRVVGPKETRIQAMVAVSIHAHKLVEEKKWIMWQWIPSDDRSFIKC